MEKKHDLLSYYHSGLCASDPQLKGWVKKGYSDGALILMTRGANNKPY